MIHKIRLSKYEFFFLLFIHILWTNLILNEAVSWLIGAPENYLNIRSAHSFQALIINFGSQKRFLFFLSFLSKLWWCAREKPRDEFRRRKDKFQFTPGPGVGILSSSFRLLLSSQGCGRPCDSFLLLTNLYFIIWNRMPIGHSHQLNLRWKKSRGQLFSFII